MTTLTLLIKAPHGAQLRQIDDQLKNQFEELDVELQILGNQTNNRWVQVSLSGEDEAIATAFINKEFGTCPTTVEKAKILPTLKGYISKVDTGKQEIRVDVGVFEPKFLQAIIPLSSLQAQLVDGKKVALQKIAELYGLVDGLPVTVKVNWENAEAGEGLGAELSAKQAARLVSWRLSFLDRLIVLGASREAVDGVLERTHLNRDVIDIETLGMFEHALTCKLGTDAAGLIPVMGRYMRYSVFAVFSAKKGMDFLGG
jgi:hypothetical protein